MILVAAPGFAHLVDDPLDISIGEISLNQSQGRREGPWDMIEGREETEEGADVAKVDGGAVDALRIAARVDREDARDVLFAPTIGVLWRG